MFFLLTAINSKYIHSNPAVYSLKAYAAAHNPVYKEKVVIKEFTINQMMEDILAGIYELNPENIGFSVYIWNRAMLTGLLPEVHKVLPNTRIFLGGPEVSYNPEEIKKEFPFITSVMVGEGENTFLKLLDSLSGDEKNDTGNASFLSESAPKMDSLPFIYNEENLKTDFSHRILYYESQRGCPYNCSYCLSSIDKSLRKRNIGDVKKHLDFFLQNKVMQVKFIDRTFNADREYAEEIWSYLKENDNGVTNFHFEVAADIMSTKGIEILSLLRPGQVQLEIGVQSTNEKTLKEINRFADTKKIAEVTKKLLLPKNVHIHLDLIAGLPYEDFESFKKSFNDVFNMHPNQLQLGFLKVLMGTEMEKKAGEYGIVYKNEPPYEVLYTNWITYSEILVLKRVEKVLEDYYNSGQFTYSIPRIISKFSSPFEFFEKLSLYYKENDYFVVTPQRSRKYDILLEFSEKLFGKAFTEELRETLTLDYYLRERPKSRPDFVKNLPDMSRIDTEKRDPITGNFIYT